MVGYLLSLIIWSETIIRTQAHCVTLSYIFLAHPVFSAIVFGIVFLAAFTVLVAGVFLVGGNFSWLVCDPLNRPTERPDMLGVSQTYTDLGFDLKFAK